MPSLPIPALRLRRALSSVVVVLAVSGAGSSAAARPTFPGVMQEQFAMACPPPCTLCHVSPAGGDPEKGDEAMAYVPGVNHRGYGVFVKNLVYMTAEIPIKTDENLKKKLTALQKTPCNRDSKLGDITDTKACDSDGDGIDDYVELSDEKQRGDPDAFGKGTSAICPEYGCGASIGTLPHDAGHSGRAGALMAALGVVLVLARRLRR